MKAFVITRDRQTYAERCVGALLQAGLDVIVVDHNSAWPNMDNWLEFLGEQSEDWDDVPRVFRDVNRHPRDLWRHDGPIWMHTMSRERFIVTDCDVVPDGDCPADWVERLGALLDEQPSAVKAGLGLRTDDLPEHYEHAATVREWERQYQHIDDGGNLHASLALGTAVWADIDTTLAMYQYFEPFALGPAIRMRAPYVARHLAWYEDTANPTPEQMFYRERAAYGHWRAPEGFNDTHHLGG